MRAVLLSCSVHKCGNSKCPRCNVAQCRSAALLSNKCRRCMHCTATIFVSQHASCDQKCILVSHVHSWQPLHAPSTRKKIHCVRSCIVHCCISNCCMLAWLCRSRRTVFDRVYLGQHHWLHRCSCPCLIISYQVYALHDVPCQQSCGTCRQVRQQWWPASSREGTHTTEVDAVHWCS